MASPLPPPAFPRGDQADLAVTRTYCCLIACKENNLQKPQGSDPGEETQFLKSLVPLLPRTASGLLFPTSC